MASPLTIPRRNTRQASTSTSHSQSLSTSLESRRVTEQPLIPSSPSTPHIMMASSSSASFSSTSTSRRSLPRRGSSLPITSQQREREIQKSPSGGQDNVMSMLQFISSTSTPSWAEVEASPLAEVPSNFPPILHDDIDMVTFLREAPGVNRTPQTKFRSLELELDVSEDVYPWSIDMDCGRVAEKESTRVDEEEFEGQVVTPELGSSAIVNEAKGNELSLQAFLEEQAMEDGSRSEAMSLGYNSPNPSDLGAGDIYGESSHHNLSSYGLDLDSDVARGKGDSHPSYAYENGSTCTIEDTLRSSDSSSCNHSYKEKASMSPSDKRLLATRSRVVSAPSPRLGIDRNDHDISHRRRDATENTATDSEERKRGGVGRVMRLAREALGIKRA
ncbi:hypothetical protein I317_04599 [Kwoniella heveanensis CBS 569]|nr:hypothetical protein I317_04599 [Kwoniella heveanensis CBS 569]